MTIELDHVIISSRTPEASARLLAGLLGVPCGPAQAGPFFAVYLNDGLTLDFIGTDEPFPVEHFCFRIDEDGFDRVLARIQAAGIPWRSAVRGLDDRRVDTAHGGRLIYWNQPDGHQWELLTVSYARQAK